MIRSIPILPLLAILLPPVAAQEPAEAAAKPKAAAEIAKAVATAKNKHKLALVAFLGEDDLSDALDRALRKDPALTRQLLYEFVVARADAATDAPIAAKYGADLAELGTPALLVLAGDGTTRAKLNKNAFWSEQRGVEPKALGGLLEKMHLEPLDAEEQLADALAAAKKNDKSLLLHFDAPW